MTGKSEKQTGDQDSKSRAQTAADLKEQMMRDYGIAMTTATSDTMRQIREIVRHYAESQRPTSTAAGRREGSSESFDGVGSAVLFSVSEQLEQQWQAMLASDGE
jgi:hypothetical protein